jgi:DNA polymerase family A
VIIRHTLGGTPVTIHCPFVGALDPFDWDAKEMPTGLHGLDVESTGLEPAGVHHPGWRMRTAQFAPTDDVAWVFRMDDPDQVEVARATLADPGNTFASHMRIDPEAVQVAFGVDVTDRFIDTHVMAIMAAPDAAAGQGSLKPAATRFNMPELEAAEEALTARFDVLYREAHPEIGRRAIKEKMLKKWGFTHIPLDDPDFLLYAGLDAIAARRLVPLLASASEAPAHVLTTERWLSQVAARAVRRGMRVDRDRLAEVIASSDAEAQAATEITMDVCGLKPSQGVALQKWWGEHGVDWTTWPDEARTDKGGPSLAKDNIKLLLRQPLDEAGRLVADAYARYSKVLDRNRRTKELLLVMDPDGYVHPGLSTVGTVTSRMACSAPNMQNFSKKDHVMRGLFLPEERHVLMSCDFAQVELRVVASLAGEQAMIDTILAGGDLHQLTADLLGVTRQEAKTINFLIVYGGGGKVLAKNLGYTRTVAECRQIIRDYWAKYPAIAALNESLKHESSVRLISGRLVPASQGRGYALMNYLIQGSSRELLVAASRRFSGGDPLRERMFWMWVHDEIILQVPEEIALEIAAAVSEAMSFDLYGVPIRADADVLIDEDGVSRWMSGDRAKEIRELVAA